MEKMRAYAITIFRDDGKIEQDIIVADMVDEKKLKKQAINNDCTIIVHEIGEVSLYEYLNESENYEDIIKNGGKCKIYNRKGENND